MKHPPPFSLHLEEFFGLMVVVVFVVWAARATIRHYASMLNPSWMRQDVDQLADRAALRRERDGART